MGVLTAEDAIRKYLSGKKTPYQLDLEIKDRKPSIVPNVGDKVKIKSREWFEKWKDEYDDVMFEHLPKFFANGMSKYCGLTMTIKEKLLYGFHIENCEENWVWLPEFFEEVYPVQEQLSSIFPKIDLYRPYLYQSPYEVKGSDTILVKHTDFASKVEETAKRLTACTLIQGLDDKPKLKQVKTTHLLKLKKL